MLNHRKRQEKKFNQSDDITQKRLRGVMAKVLDCNLKVSEFELQACYYVHFRTNTLGEGINPFLSPLAIGEIETLLLFYNDCRIKQLSSKRVDSTDVIDSLSLLFPLGHHTQCLRRVGICILCWSLNLGVYIWRSHRTSLMRSSSPALLSMSSPSFFLYGL